MHFDETGDVCRVKKVTMMTEKVAGGVLSGVLKVSGYFSSSVANSRFGKKFLKLVPGEMALATLDGFSKPHFIYILLLGYAFLTFIDVLDDLTCDFI